MGRIFTDVRPIKSKYHHRKGSVMQMTNDRLAVIFSMKNSIRECDCECEKLLQRIKHRDKSRVSVAIFCPICHRTAYRIFSTDELDALSKQHAPKDIDYRNVRKFAFRARNEGVLDSVCGCGAVWENEPLMGSPHTIFGRHETPTITATIMIGCGICGHVETIRTYLPYFWTDKRRIDAYVRDLFKDSSLYILQNGAH